MGVDRMISKRIGPGSATVEKKLLALRQKVAQTPEFKRFFFFLFRSARTSADCFCLSHLEYAVYDRLLPTFLSTFIGILDSCAAGALRSAKAVLQLTILVQVAPDLRAICFFLTSTSERDAQESGRLRGSFSPRAGHGTARGATNSDGDQRITLRSYRFCIR